MDVELLLSRYLDDAMDDAERAAFEQRLAAEPQLAARLEDWHRRDADIAGDLALMLDLAPAPRPFALPAAPVDELAERRAAKAQAAQAAQATPRRWFAPAAMAASIALAGVLSFALLKPSFQPEGLDALSELPAGQTVTLADGSQLTAILSFAAGDGRWCREYAFDDGRGGIACNNDGGWKAETEFADAGAMPANTDAGYATAAGSSSEALDAAYARLQANDPISPEEEAQLIESGWTNSPE